MNRALLFLLLLPAIASGASPDWQRTLSPAKPGAFPPPPALKATYRIGWMKVSAGEAKATLSKPQRNVLQLDVTGGSTGAVRSLWKLDASQTAQTRLSTLRPIRLSQSEDYGWKKTVTKLTFTSRGVTGEHLTTPPDDAVAEKQKFQFANLRDLLSAMLYVRSQPLATGDTYNLVAYPANTPYLATLRIIGNEKLEVGAGKFDAVKMEVRLQKITPTLTLQPHQKFKRAFAWVSNDDKRILLRVEAEIFVGSVWLDLQSVKYAP